MDTELETGRNPIRFLIKMTLFLAALYFAGKFAMQQKEQWEGLTASEARAKIEPKLVDRLGEDKAQEIVDQIVAALVERGVIKEDDVVVEEAEEVVEAAAGIVEEAADSEESDDEDE